MDEGRGATSTCIEGADGNCEDCARVGDGLGGSASDGSTNHGIEFGFGPPEGVDARVRFDICESLLGLQVLAHIRNACISTT